MSKYLGAILLACLLIFSFAGGAAADTDAEAELISLINEERQSEGLSEVTVSDQLTSVAREHSQEMADADDIYHNPDLTDEVTGWTKIGENVGRGPYASTIHIGFMDSPDHREVILLPDWHHVGVGVVRQGGQLWVTEIFIATSDEPPEECPEGTIGSPPNCEDPPERTCGDGPDLDSDEYEDSGEWKEWYEANCIDPVTDCPRETRSARGYCHGHPGHQDELDVFEEDYDGTGVGGKVGNPVIEEPEEHDQHENEPTREINHDSMDELPRTGTNPYIAAILGLVLIVIGWYTVRRTA